MARRKSQSLLRQRIPSYTAEAAQQRAETGKVSIASSSANTFLRNPSLVPTSRSSVSIASSSANTFLPRWAGATTSCSTVSIASSSANTFLPGPAGRGLAGHAVSIASSSANTFLRGVGPFDTIDVFISLNRFFVSEYLPTLLPPALSLERVPSQSLLRQRIPSYGLKVGAHFVLPNRLNRFFVSEYLPTLRKTTSTRIA